MSPDYTGRGRRSESVNAELAPCHFDAESKNPEKTLAEALAGPVRANGRKRRFYDTEVRGLALRVTPTGEKAFTLFDRVLGKPPSMTLADARQIARGAGANDVQPFRYLEVCAGLGSASLAFEPLGWRCAGMSEIDRKARAFLAQRFPDTKLHGDFRKITPAKAGRIDLLVGGPPCAPWSKTNREKSIEDPRRDLAFEFIELARTVEAPWFVFENVPGLVQSDDGRSVWRQWLKRADDCGYAVAWRVLDARQFGLPTRRKRLFAVGHLGRPEAAYRTLFEPRRASYAHPEQAIARQGRSYAKEARAVALNQTFNDFTDFMPTLRSTSPGFAGVLIDEEVLRRFTITELERSMGFPDGWTAFDWNGKPATYAMRAALLGNAFCPPILHWIGEGIAANSVAGTLAAR